MFDPDRFGRARNQLQVETPIVADQLAKIPRQEPQAQEVSAKPKVPTVQRFTVLSTVQFSGPTASCWLLDLRLAPEALWWGPKKCCNWWIPQFDLGSSGQRSCESWRSTRAWGTAFSPWLGPQFRLPEMDLKITCNFKKGAVITTLIIHYHDSF